MRIDAHQHFWQIGRNGHEWPDAGLAEIHRDFVPADLDPLLERHGIARTVLVQSQPNDADTDWMLGLAAETPSIAAVVGWVDMRAAHAPDRIAQLAADPKLRGLRPMLQGLPADWILDPACAPALAAMEAHQIVLEALIRPQHLPAIAQIARTYPRLQVVIDHAAKPDIAAQSHEPWARNIDDIANLPNVSAKMSGLLTEAQPGAGDGDLRFYVDHLLRCFGPDRLLWGSDWPVLLLASSYAEWLAMTDRLIGHLPHHHQAEIMGGTAARIYRLA